VVGAETQSKRKAVDSVEASTNKKSQMLKNSHGETGVASNKLKRNVSQNNKRGG